jgi:uncharacterized protein YifN (PemK superfamily)
MFQCFVAAFVIYLFKPNDNLLNKKIFYDKFNRWIDADKLKKT